MFNLKAFFIAVVVAVSLFFGGDVMAQTANAEVTAAATSFTAWLTDNLPIIGGALIGGAAIAVGWKWLKGMFFS